MFNSKAKAVLGFLLAFLFAGSIFTLPARSLAAGNSSSGATITKIGERAFEDLATCLASYKTPVLDVFYLVDNSGSLSYTDPEYVRSDVLGSSIKELESFKNQGVAVNYAAQLFASDIEKVQAWTPLEGASDFQSASKTLVKRIKNNFGGYTDWEQGLNYAYKQLSSRPANHCKMLIWFTDGGINPTGDFNDALASLKKLCNSGLSSSSLGATKGPYGLMAKIRKAGISLFGVLYQNDASTLDEYKKDNDDDVAKLMLQSEHNRMEFMAPLVEGVGTVSTEDPFETIPSGGKVQCGPLDEAGYAPAGQPNGAFVRAQDPVDLAFQFLSMQAVLAGGSGRPIVDGKFNVPAGTAAFRVLTTSGDWSLTGPDGSGIKISSKDKSSSSKLTTTSTAGVQQLDFTVSGAKKFLGQWKFDDGKGNSALFLFSGLTIQLDRDQQSQIVSDRENSLTGRIVRKPEYSNMALNLDLYGKNSLSLSQPDANGNLREIPGLSVTLDKNGQFKVDGLKPDAAAQAMDLWVSLNLGEDFDPVTANFGVDVVSKKDITSAKTNLVTLTNLVGPKGKATGTISLVGPTTQDSSEFCIADPAVRTDDTQTSAQKHPRDNDFVWSFDGTELNGQPYCVTLAKGETKDVAVTVTNKTQANAHVVSIRETSSKSAGASLAETIQFEFKSETQTNSAVEFWVTIILLILGLLLPLLLLYAMNWATTKFLPVSSVARAEYPVKIQTGGAAKIAGKDGQPITLAANDFKYLPNEDKASRNLTIGNHGTASAKMAWFPLLPSWFQQEATPGNRVISLYAESGKRPSFFQNGKASEISPNPAANWFLSIPDSEFAKANGESMDATLVVASQIANLPDYQKRVMEISAKPGLQGRIDEIRSAIAAEANDPKAGGKPGKKVKPAKAGKSPVADEGGGVTLPTLPPVPGVGNISGVPGVTTDPTTTIPGAGIPGVPGVPGVPGIPGTPSSSTNSNPTIPGIPNNIPGIKPPNS